MGTFIKKDLLVFWRDRKEVLLALILPVILIVVLNFAFAGLFSDDKEIQLNIGFVQEDDEAKGFHDWEEKIEAQGFSEEEKTMILSQARALSPVTLIHHFLNNPEMSEWMSIQELTEREAKELVQNGDLDAIIKVPEGFTSNVLASAFLGEEAKTELVIQAENHSSELTTLENILNNFVHSINMQFAIGNSGDAVAEPQLPQGGREVLEGVDTYTISQYFTIAISTLFGLFIAQTVSTKTLTEKRERVFNRILLTNSNPIRFLIGKTFATFLLTWFQIIITFVIIQLLLNVFEGKSLRFWIGFFIMFTIYALTVAGLSAIFTTMTLNMQDSNAASGLSTLIIMGFGALGGSFFPIQGLPLFMQKIGEWTPNGITQVALIEWIQFGKIEDLMVPIIALIVTFIIFIAIGLAMFPKKGVA